MIPTENLPKNSDVAMPNEQEIKSAEEDLDLKQQKEKFQSISLVGRERTTL